MAHFNKGGGEYAPFGKNNFLRSTQPGSFLTESYTVGTETFPVEQIDGHDQKVLIPGEAMAKVTSGPDAGKIAPFQAGATDGREDPANLVGVNKPHVPVQLNDRDVEVGVVYIGSLVQAWCTERDATGARVPLTNATADALRGTKGLQINFK